MNRVLRHMFFAVLGFLVAATATLYPVAAEALPYNVTVDTSALVGTGTFVFDFIDGGDPGNNQAVVSNFLPVPSVPGSIDAGHVTGNLDTSPPLTLFDDDLFSFISTFLQPVTLGGLFQFTVDVSTNPPVGLAAPDSFSFSIFDEFLSTPLVTTDLGSALFQIDSVGTPLLGIQDSPDTAPITLAPATVPEPGTLLLLALGLPVLVGTAIRHRAGRSPRREI